MGDVRLPDISHHRRVLYGRKGFPSGPALRLRPERELEVAVKVVNVGVDGSPGEIVENPVKGVGLCGEHRLRSTEIAICGDFDLRGQLVDQP